MIKAALLRTVLPFLFLAVSITGFAGTIPGQMTPAKGSLPKFIILRNYINSAKGDTINIGTFGDFKVEVPYDFPVSCILNIGRSYFSFMYNPAEKDARINLTVENGVLTKGVTDGSRENLAYGEIEKLMQEFDKLLYYRVKDNDPGLANYIEEYNAALNEFQVKYKGTYSAEVLAQMRKIKTDKKLQPLESMRQYFFDNVNFADSSTVANAMLSNMIDFYSMAICDTGKPARESFVSMVMNKSKANPFVYKKAALEFYNGFFESNNESMMAAYLQWFSANADTIALPVLNVKIKLLKRVMPGQPAIDIAIMENGKTLASLKETAAENKLTLLMIWESHCSHCREAIPKVKELYTTYHDKGFQVYGVSLDNEKSEWEAYVTENDLKWKNILAKQSTGKLEEYYIQNTPMFALIDKNGNIVRRLIDIKGVQRYLKENLQ